MNTVAGLVRTDDTHGDRLAYTFNEAARLLGVSRQTVGRMCAAGRLHEVDTGTTARLVAAWSLVHLIDANHGRDSAPGPASPPGLSVASAGRGPTPPPGSPAGEP